MIDDLLWSMRQASRVLQDLRLDIRGVWVDEAARELTSRYLDPHESEDQQMLVGLDQQKNALDQAQTKLRSAEGWALQAEECAVAVADGLNASERELQSAYGDYDTYAHYHAEARSRFPTIQNLINQANSACRA